MEVKDKEKLNIPLKGWKILSAISLMVFHTVQCWACFPCVQVGDSNCGGSGGFFGLVVMVVVLLGVVVAVLEMCGFTRSFKY